MNLIFTERVDCMSREKSKNILGIFAVLIMMHHLGQKASASWVPATVRQHGLEPFVPIGFLLVSFFFFCSGYGLIKSMDSKEDYFKGFLVKRLNRILMVFVITQIIYFVFRITFSVLGLPLNPYSWYVYTIIVLYIGFFLIYRKLGASNRRLALILMAVWILGYSIICYLQIQGNWWINSAPVFLMGIFMADREKARRASEKDSEKIKGDNANVPAPGRRRAITILAVTAVITVATFILSENMVVIYNNLHMTNYGIINFIIVILQIICGSAFSLLIYNIAVMTGRSRADRASVAEATEAAEESISAKASKNPAQKIMAFYGAMTLEFYLIHGLFVQLFGHHFMNDTTKPVCYIKNIFLYVVVVLAVATATSFAIKKLADLLQELYDRAPAFQNFCDDFKKYGLILLGILVVVTVGFSINRHRISAETKADMEKYQQEFLQTVNINGTDISVYTAGEGEYTVVLLGSEDNPCSTLYLRPLADKLSNRYRVVIIDYPGKGFSGESDEDRTLDFFADTVHLTLNKLGMEENVILVPNVTSGLYAYRYIEKYPDNIAGLMCVDAMVPAVATHFLEGNFNNLDEYQWFMKRIVRYQGLEQKLMVATGYVKVQMPIYEYLFYGSGLKKYYPLMEEMFVRRYMQSAELKERAFIYDNCMGVADFKLPEDLPTTFLLDDYLKSNNIYGVNWRSQYKKMITSEDLQTVEIVAGDPYMIFYNPDILSKKVDELVERITQ